MGIIFDNILGKIRSGKSDASGGGGAVTSVFSRTGAVAALASDYDASQVDNDSTVTGTTVKDALETLEAGLNSPNNNIIINSITDFANQNATTIFIEDNKKYIFAAGLGFFLSKDLDFTAVANICTIDFGGAGVFFSGTTAFTGTPAGAVVVQNGILIGGGTETVFDYEGVVASPFSVLRLRNMGFTGFAKTGKISGVNALDVEVNLSDAGTGWQLEDCGTIRIGGSRFISSVTTSSPKISLSGSFGPSIIINGSLPLIQAGESFIQISSDATFGSVQVVGSAFDDAAGGEFLASAKAGSITVFSDNGSGGTTVTSVAHALTTEQRLAITGTTSYNGTHNISAVTTNTFDIDVAFVANDATGTFTTGDSNDFLDNNSFMFTSNGDQLDTNEIGSMSMSVPFTETITTIDTPVMVDTANWVAGQQRRFLIGTSELDYTGAIEIPTRVIGLITLDSASGNDQLSAYMAVNGTIIPESRVTAIAGTATTFAPSALVNLMPSDSVSIFIENNSDTSNIGVDVASVQVHKV